MLVFDVSKAADAASRSPGSAFMRGVPVGRVHTDRAERVGRTDAGDTGQIDGVVAAERNVRILFAPRRVTRSKEFIVLIVQNRSKPRAGGRSYEGALKPVRQARHPFNAVKSAKDVGRSGARGLSRLLRLARDPQGLRNVRRHVLRSTARSFSARVVPRFLSRTRKSVARH